MGSRRRNEPHWPGSSRDTRDYEGYGLVNIETRAPRGFESYPYGGSHGGVRQPEYEYDDYQRPSGREPRRSRYDDERDPYSRPEPRRERSPVRRYAPQRKPSYSPEPAPRRRREPRREPSYSPGQTPFRRPEPRREPSYSPEPTPRRRSQPRRERSYSPEPARGRLYSPERGPGHDLPRAPTPPPAVRPSRPEASSSTSSAPAAPRMSATDRRIAGYEARLAELDVGAADRAQRKVDFERRYGGSSTYGNYSDSD